MTEQGFATARDGTRLAYCRIAGHLPGVMFLGGFRSDMTGAKATFLEAWCQARGRAFLRFDYSGHGASGGDFALGTIGRWSEDAIDALDALTKGPQVLVGSSMGGWVMLEAALARPQRVAALVGIAAAPDFTEDLMWEAASPAMQAALLRHGFVRQPSEYDPAGYLITRALIEDGRTRLRLRGRIPFSGPVRLLHGMQDADVPWQTSLRLAEALDSQDARVTLVKDGEHRMSREADLALLGETLGALLGQDGGQPLAV